MIIVVLLIFFALFVYGANTDGEISTPTGLFCSFVSFCVLIFLLIKISGLGVIDKKIEMYQTENEKIENQIAECVKQYQQYENDTLTEFAPDSVVTLVTLYPELKSDELVKKQIEVYIANNEKIKELKEKKIEGKVYRWWVYFGGGGDSK